ncbi:MAG: phenylalanine--tRNA ligase subunit beta [Proteobacteria bacterium]|nr:phenylalanine--tRNA ligase subunit beta [Pseudomonadota bacterium]
MKVSELWLREWVNPSIDKEQLASLMTMAGLEVDALNPVAGNFNGVIVAEVLNTKPHPEADKLTLCEVNIGKSNPLKIVCGAKNVRPNLKVALAQIGAELPHGLSIKETHLRGELSQGMLCSSSELGLSEGSEGIIELSDDAPVGMDLRDYLSLDDYVFDVDLTPNRADCFSVLGVARDIAALTETACKEPLKQEIKSSIDDSLDIQIKAKKACSRYCGRIIRNINSQAKTPHWMSERLRRAGVRAIHPVVDVTNYVMLNIGQPMHAFDLNRLDGHIEVRVAKENEELELLDSNKITLDQDVLVVADANKALAIAGIMGGEESAVNDETNDVFLEAAFFNPLEIAKTARRFNLSSDSSQRFERGVDYNLPLLAIEQATALLLEIVGGVAGPVSTTENEAELPRIKPILFNPQRVKKLTGLDIAETQMKAMLERLQLKVDDKKMPWTVAIPSHRFDLSLEVDLVEEIFRLFGADKIEGEKLVAAVQAGTINDSDKLIAKAVHFFKARAYHETISYSFVDPELQQAIYPNQEVMRLLNPISSEMSEMRLGMWPGLIASTIYNIHRQQPSIKFFESGVVFEMEEGLLKEKQAIAGLLVGEASPLNWCEKEANFDFYDLKGDIEAFLESIDIANVAFVREAHPALHPGKSAAIYINNILSGWCGVLHPRLADALDLQEEVILFELKVENLIGQATPLYKQISKFPQMRRDLSLLVDNDIPAAEIEALVRHVVSKDCLKDFAVFDVYTGENIPAGKKSLAIAIILQDDKRTMVDSEINTIISAIIKELDDKFAIILRD